MVILLIVFFAWAEYAQADFEHPKRFFFFFQKTRNIYACDYKLVVYTDENSLLTTPRGFLS